MNISRERILGIALIAGGALVGVVVIVLLSSYARRGGVTAVTATLGVILGMLLLVLPQFALGIYLIWQDLRPSAAEDDI